jgi:A/G-specific adenine glycosylase
LKPVEDALWRRADALLPVEGIESYTQGLMDLGATLCTRSSPDCGRCPLQQRCVAYATGQTLVLPVRKPKKAVPEKQAALMAVVHGGQVLLEQRPDTGIWGGLMSLPELDGHQARDGEATVIEDVVRAAGAFGEVEETEALLPLVHVFTHYKLHIAPYRIGLAKRVELDSRYVWWDMARIEQAPLPAPVKKLLAELAKPGLFS